MTICCHPKPLLAALKVYKASPIVRTSETSLYSNQSEIVAVTNIWLADYIFMTISSPSLTNWIGSLSDEPGVTRHQRPSLLVFKKIYTRSLPNRLCLPHWAGADSWS